jgi:hypothetical protein
MSYLPPTSLYQPEPEPQPVPQPAPEPVKVILPQPPAPQVQIVERIVERVIERPVEVSHPVTPPVVERPASPPPNPWVAASGPVFISEQSNIPAPMIEPLKIEPLQLEPPKVETPPPPEKPAHKKHREKHHEKRHEPETVTRPADKPAKRHFIHRVHKAVLRHVKRDKSIQPDPDEPDLLRLGVTVLGSIAMGLMIWGAYSTLPRFGMGGNLLRVDAGSPKLKVVSGDYAPRPYDPKLAARPRHQPEPPLVPPVPAVPIHQSIVPPAPPAPPLDHGRPFGHSPLAHPEPPAFHGNKLPPVDQTIIPIDSALPGFAHRAEPVVFVKPHEGETPMIRNWETLARYSMLLAALGAPPVNRAFAQEVNSQIPAADYSKRLDELTTSVNKLAAEMKALNQQKVDDKLEDLRKDLSAKIAAIKVEDTTELKLQLAQIQKTLKFLIDNPPAPVAAGNNAAAPANVARLEEVIKNELGSIRDAILKSNPRDRVALSMPQPNTVLDPPPAKSTTARIVFVNLYKEDLFLMVNDKPNRVAKGTTFTLENVAAGPISISVRSHDTVYDRRTPELKANETYTLTATP